MKRLLRVSLLIFFIAILGGVHFAAGGPKVLVNGAALDLQEKLIVRDDGYIYISLRDIACALNFEINWLDDKNTVNIKNDNMIIGIQADNQWYSKKTKDGKLGSYKFDAATVPKLIEGKIYVPIGNFTIVAGGRIAWDGASNTYSIIYDAQLNYPSNTQVSVYAGTGKKGNEDGALRESQFRYAQSIYTTKDKVTYVSDAGVIRTIKDGTVETLQMEPAYVKVAALKGIDNDVYALSAKYTNATKEEVYGIFKIQDNTFKEIHTQSAKEAKIIDFDTVSATMICLLKEDITTGQRYLEIIDLKGNTKPVKTEVSAGFNCLAADTQKVYLGNKNGTIHAYDIKAKTLEILAGTENVHRFQDGNDPLFCVPRKMKYYKGNLYILDFNVIRKISLGNQGELSSCRVVAGKATGALNPKMSSGAGEELLLSTINPIDFCMSEEGLLLTDPTQFKIMKIK